MSQLFSSGWRRWIALLCCTLLAPSLLAQTPSAGGMRIIIVQGDNAENMLQQIPPEPLTVAVVDRTGRPVAGALVTFTAPDNGPTGDFANGLHALTVLADDNGRAFAPQFRPNDVIGSYRIEVVAERAGERATTSIAQRNVGPKKSFRKVLVVLAIAGAAAGAAVAAGGSGGNSNATSTPPVTTTPSTPTISFGGSNVGPPG